MPDTDFTPALDEVSKGGPITARERALMAAERERCAKQVESVRQGEILLAAGEMSAQEMRAVKAMLPWLAYRIRNHEGKPPVADDLKDISIGGYYRHKRTGGVYQVLCLAIIEATMTNAVVYAAKKDGKVERWVRPVAEFCDGRFEPADMTPNREGKPP